MGPLTEWAGPHAYSNDRPISVLKRMQRPVICVRIQPVPPLAKLVAATLSITAADAPRSLPTDDSCAPPV